MNQMTLNLNRKISTSFRMPSMTKSFTSIILYNFFKAFLLTATATSVISHHNHHHYDTKFRTPTTCGQTKVFNYKLAERKLNY